MNEKIRVKRKGETFWIDPNSIAGKTYQKIKQKFKSYGHRLNMPEYTENDKPESYVEIDIKCMNEIQEMVDILVNKMKISSTASINQCILPMLQTSKQILRDYSEKGELNKKNLEEYQQIMVSMPSEFLSKFFA